MPYSLLVNGLTGKLGVIILGQVMCVFAYRSSEKNPVKYYISRYLYFVICGGIVNFLYIVTGIYDQEIAVRDYVRYSLMLSDAIFPTFWCMKSFLLAGFVAYLNGQTKASSLVILIETVLLWKSGNFWAAISLMGCLPLSLLNNNKIRSVFNHGIVKAGLLIFVFWAIKRPESYVAYIIDAICTMLFIIVIETSEILKKSLCIIKPMVFCGKYTMTIFMIHNGVYLLLAKWLFGLKLFEGLLYHVTFLLIFIISFCVIMLIAIPMQYILDKALFFIRKGYELLDAIMN